jgi:hypothetical protein
MAQEVLTYSEKERRTVLRFAIAISFATFLFFFMSAFQLTFLYPNLEIIKTILPFLFSTASGLWGFYWGSSKGSQDKEVNREEDAKRVAEVSLTPEKPEPK